MEEKATVVGSTAGEDAEAEVLVERNLLNVDVLGRARGRKKDM